MTKTEIVVEDAVLFLPRTTIHPDPDQPRVKVDAELQGSIDAQGIIQAITVRPHPSIENEWMIVDGERRWLGGAHLKTIPCRIRLDLEDSVDRLITQLAANTGKPLSPIEQARAFKKALDEDPRLTQAKLAEALGIPRSTIGDRIRLIEIHPAWMKLIESGRLQVSHAPLIHQYRAVPDEYQVKAAKNVSEGQGWQMQKYKDSDDVIPIATFRTILRGAFRDFVVRLDKVRSYKGPVLEIEEEQWSYGPGANKIKKVKYAADITLWRPIRREAEKREKKTRQSSGHVGGQRYESSMSKALKTLKAAGLDVPVRKTQSYHLAPKDGETEIYDSNGWASGIHPQTLLEKLDPSKLTLIQGTYGEGKLVASDDDAVEAAQAAYQKHAEEVSKKELASVRAKLTPAVLEKYAVRGAGVPHLLMALQPEGGSPKVIALAVGLSINGPVDEDVIDEDDAILDNDSQSDAEKLVSAIAAVAALRINVPDEYLINNKINAALRNVAFKIRPSLQQLQKERVSAVQADVAKSKKQQKREARAAGEQVGDPKRAKQRAEPIADDFEIGEPEDADVLIGEEEEEMIEA